MNEIYLYGTVGGGWWDEESFTPNTVRDQLAGMSGPVTIRINSGGGIAADGQTIYTMLRDYPDAVDVVVDGIAASAASLIAMAGDTITMRLGSTMMIHDPASPWTEGRGTEEDHLDAARGLAVISNAYAAVYAKRAGVSAEDAREVMKAETYYDGDLAVAAGFATATDEEIEAEAVARFDYRIYARAPSELIDAGGTFAKRTSRKAIMAHLAGTSAPHTLKGKTMAPRDIRLEDQSDEANQEELDEGDPEMAGGVDEGDQDGGDGGAEGDDEEGATDATALSVQIMDLCEASNRPMSEARDYTARGLTLTQVVAEITTKRSKEAPMSQNRSGAPRARIMRDERDTRRTGMTQAVIAQIMRAAPATGPARKYMDMSLVEMAAECVDYRGPMRNAGQKAEVFMQASHATSDFPAIFENAMNKVLLERYELAEPTFKRISRQRNFNDFRAHPMVRAGDFPKLQPVKENGEIKFGTFGEGRETAILAPYAIGIRISRQMMVNDELGAIDEVLSDYGQSVADFEEETFYAFALDASLSNGKMFRSANNNLAAAGSAISVTSISAGRAAMRKQVSIDKKKLNMTPSIILVGPNQETAAEQLVATVQPQEAGNVNPFSGRLEPVVTAQIADNRWHLFASADRPGGACFVHGYLDGAEAPRMRTDEAFGQQGMAMTLEHDFGLGAVDYRGGYKNGGQA
jgi:ATP-dependent protease ClpP protease subunit